MTSGGDAREEAGPLMRGGTRIGGRGLLAALVGSSLMAFAGTALAQSAEEVARRLYGSAYTDTVTQRTSCLALIALAGLGLLAYYLHRTQSTRLGARRESDFREVVDQIEGVVHMPNLLRVGQRVEIEHEAGRSRRLYGSYVQEVGPTSVLLGAPRHDGILVPLHPEEVVGVIVRHEQHSYRMEGEVLERRAGQIASVLVSRSDWVTRFQRRDYFRVQIQLDARFEQYRRGFATPSELHREGVIVNLSASGCRLLTGGPISKAKFCVVEFRLPGIKHPLRAAGEVVMSQPGKRGMFGASCLACQFIDLKRPDREAIMAYVRDVELRRIRAKREREDDATDKGATP
jgi:c-di-GMP-binding flagellar brake protein YcgR